MAYVVFIQYGSILATVLEKLFPIIEIGITYIIISYRTWLGEDLTIKDRNQIFTNVEKVLCVIIFVIKLISSFADICPIYSDTSKSYASNNF